MPLPESEFPTSVVILRTATSLLELLTSAWPDSNSRVLQCRLKSSESMYLHVEVALLADPSVRGEMLIPHQYVEVVITNKADSILGFVQATR